MDNTFSQTNLPPGELSFHPSALPNPDLVWRRKVTIRVLAWCLIGFGIAFATLQAALPLSCLPLLWLHFAIAMLAGILLGVSHFRPNSLPLLPLLLTLLALWVGSVELLYAGQLSLQFLTIQLPVLTMFCYANWAAWASVALAMLAKEAVLCFARVFFDLSDSIPVTDNPKYQAVYQGVLLAGSLIIALILAHVQSLNRIAPQVVPSAFQQRLLSERALTRRLVHNILPAGIADELMEAFQNGGIAPLADGKFAARTHNLVTIAFADIVGFTKLAEQCPPQLLVSTLDSIFSSFDEACASFGVEKIKTIGDCYMCCAIPREEADAADCAFAVLQLCCTMHTIIPQYTLAQRPLSIRAGMACGTVTAGIIGKMKFCYDIWGDAVNTASRMESTGIIGATQVTEKVFNLLRDTCGFIPRGPVEVKGKGTLCTWLHWPKGGLAIRASNPSFGDLERSTCPEVMAIPTGLRSMWTSVVNESVDGCSTCTALPERFDFFPSSASTQRAGAPNIFHDISVDPGILLPPIPRLGIQATPTPMGVLPIPRVLSLSGCSETDFAQSFSALVQPRNQLSAKRFCFQCP